LVAFFIDANGQKVTQNLGRIINLVNAPRQLIDFFETVLNQSFVLGT